MNLNMFYVFIIIKITFDQNIYIGKDKIYNNVLFIIDINKMNLNLIYF